MLKKVITNQFNWSRSLNIDRHWMIDSPVIDWEAGGDDQLTVNERKNWFWMRVDDEWQQKNSILKVCLSSVVIGWQTRNILIKKITTWGEERGWNYVWTGQSAGDEEICPNNSTFNWSDERKKQKLNENAAARRLVAIEKSAQSWFRFKTGQLIWNTSKTCLNVQKWSLFKNMKITTRIDLKEEMRFPRRFKTKVIIIWMESRQ